MLKMFPSIAIPTYYKFSKQVKVLIDIAHPAHVSISEFSKF